MQPWTSSSSSSVSSSSSFSSLKVQKEAFVTGHNGTSPVELLLVCLSSPVGLFLFHQIRHYYNSRCDEKTKNKAPTPTPTTGGERQWGRGRHIVRMMVQEGTTWMIIVIEFLVIFVPMILCQTELLYPWGISILCVELFTALVLAVSSILPSQSQNRNWMKTSQQEQQQQQQETNNKEKDEEEEAAAIQIEYLTSYRSTVIAMTCIAILAVDFHLFPRRFVKTEHNGYGLMDLGSGSYIFSGALVTSRKKNGKNEQQQKTAARGKTVFTRFIILVLLGTVRLITNKGVEYQEHVSEYGVHWNFFFTLATVMITSSIIREQFSFSSSHKYRLVLPIVLLTTYQILLSCFNLQQWIENGDRQCWIPSSSSISTTDDNENNADITAATARNSYNYVLCDLVASNREGILGCIGYLSLHLLTEQISSFCIWQHCNDTTQQREQYQHLHKHTTNKQVTMVITTMKDRWEQSFFQQGKCIFFICVMTWTSHGLLTLIMQIPTSRRSTNASYVSWVLAHNATFLFLTWMVFYISEISCSNGSTAPIIIKRWVLAERNCDAPPPQATEYNEEEREKKEEKVTSPPILNAMNRHGLIVFLVANLLTGLVNLVINTLEVHNAQALIVICVYMVLVGSVALILDCTNFAFGSRRAVKQD